MTTGVSNQRWLATALLVALLTSLVVRAQTAQVRSAQRVWTPTLAEDGHPILEGVWENNSAMPLAARAARQQAGAHGRRARHVPTPRVGTVQRRIDRRTAPDTLEYTFTVDNPTMWTRPWTATIN